MSSDNTRILYHAWTHDGMYEMSLKPRQPVELRIELLGNRNLAGALLDRPVLGMTPVRPGDDDEPRPDNLLRLEFKGARVYFGDGNVLDVDANCQLQYGIIPDEYIARRRCERIAIKAERFEPGSEVGVIREFEAQLLCWGDVYDPEFILLRQSALTVTELRERLSGLFYSIDLELPDRDADNLYVFLAECAERAAGDPEKAWQAAVHRWLDDMPFEFLPPTETFPRSYDIGGMRVTLERPIPDTAP